jgi:endoglucanase
LIIRHNRQIADLQRSIGAAFDPAEFGRLNTFVEQTTAKGVHVILDPHIFARYYLQPAANYQNATVGLLGNDVPYSAFADFWSRLAELYQGNDRVIFGLMNEPANMPAEHWVAAANAAIAAIRAQGATNLITVGWLHAMAANPSAPKLCE